MATAHDWIAGMRPLTLPASLAPVLIASGAAAGLGLFNLPRALLAAGISLLSQIGANLSNDYSDGVRGVDVNRVGPMRLTASGLAPPKQVLRAAQIAFALVALLGVWLSYLTGHWWFMLVGAAIIAGAWFYVGGKNPYGFHALGELSVFIYFGLVATLIPLFAQAGRLSVPGVLGAIGVGLVIVGILVANNLRDIPTDAATGKRTLAVVLGDRATRRLYCACIWVPLFIGILAGLWAPWAPLVALLIYPAYRLTMPVLAGQRGLQLVPVLKGTGLFALAFGAILAVAYAIT